MKFNTRSSVNRTRINSSRHHWLFSVDKAAISQVFCSSCLIYLDVDLNSKMGAVVTFVD